MNFLFSSLVGLMLCFGIASKSRGEELPSVVEISRGANGQVEYRYGGRVESIEKIYALLSLHLERAGRNSEFDVLFEDEVPFSYVIDMRGILQQKGYLNIKYFVFSESRQRMMEVLVGGSRPLPEQ